MQNDLSHLKAGGMIAIDNKDRNWGSAPYITRRLYRVTKRTPTQAEAVNGHHEHLTIRVLVSGGKVIGDKWVCAIVATPEIIERHNAEVAARNRWNKARARLGDLVGTHLHQLNLSVEQMEVLADAWGRVKAMGEGGAA